MAKVTAPPPRRARLLLPILGMLAACVPDSTPTEQSGPDRATAATAFVPEALLRHVRPAPAQPRSRPLATTCSGGCPADSVVIDFEGLGGAGDILLLQDEYETLGIHFANAIVAIIPGFYYDEYPPRSGVSVATADPLETGDGSGILYLSLDSAAIRVRGYVTSFSPLALRCFDAQGTLLGETVFPGGNLAILQGGPANQPVEVTAPGIQTCQFVGPDNEYSLDDLTVVWNDGEAPELTCDSVFRGENTECRVTGVGTVLGWHFEGILGARLLGQDSVVSVSSASSDTVWFGIGVLSGEVSVLVQTGSAVDTLTAAWTVLPRTGPDWRWGEANWLFQQDSAAICAYNDLVIVGDTIRGNLAVNRRRSGCGQSELGSIEPNLEQDANAGTTIAQVPLGPNQGFWYVTGTSFHFDRVAEMNPFIRPEGPTHLLPNGPDYNACKQALGLQGNPLIEISFHQFNTVCKGFDLNSLYTGIWAHEGFGTQNPLDSATANGHEARRQIAARNVSNDPRFLVESYVGSGSAFQFRVLIKDSVVAADDRITLFAGDATGLVKDNYLDPAGGCGKAHVFRVSPNPPRYFLVPLTQSINGVILCL